jgi:hypothetical protein
LADAYGYRIDIEPPQVELVEYASQTIRVHFSEPIDASTFTADANVTPRDVKVTSFADNPNDRIEVPITGLAPVAGTSNRVWDITVQSFPADGLILQLGEEIYDLYEKPLGGYQTAVWDLDAPLFVDWALSMPGPIGPWGTGALLGSNNLLVAFNESIDVASLIAGLNIIGPSGSTLSASVSPFSGVGFNEVPGLHSCNFLISFVPDSQQPWGTYTVELDALVEDLFHNPLSPITWTFDRQPTVLERTRGFADELVARFEAFPEKWIPFGDPRNPPDPLPDWRDYAVAKSLLVHTAFDAGPLGPDGNWGWGIEDYDQAGRFLKDLFGDQPSRMVQEQIYSGKAQSWQVFVDGSRPLRATLGWNDPNGPQERLDHDLNMWITGPDGKVYSPWSFNKDGVAVQSTGNHTDDVEQVLIDKPQRGVYTIHVGHSGTVREQAYSLVVDASPFQLEAGRLTVLASSQADRFDFTAGARHTAQLNGQKYLFDPKGVKSVQFTGGAADTAILTGSAGKDTATLTPKKASLVGTGYAVEVNGVGSVSVVALGGKDTATLYDSTGNDLFSGWPTDSTLTGPGYTQRVEGFERVNVYATAGGADRAYLYDSTGDDRLFARANYGSLSGAGFYNYFQGFDRVLASSTRGGKDSLELALIDYIFERNGKWL